MELMKVPIGHLTLLAVSALRVDMEMDGTLRSYIRYLPPTNNILLADRSPTTRGLPLGLGVWEEAIGPLMAILSPLTGMVRRMAGPRSAANICSHFLVNAFWVRQSREHSKPRMM